MPISIFFALYIFFAIVLQYYPTIYICIYFQMFNQVTVVASGATLVVAGKLRFFRLKPQISGGFLIEGRMLVTLLVIHIP